MRRYDVYSLRARDGDGRSLLLCGLSAAIVLLKGLDSFVISLAGELEAWALLWLIRFRCAGIGFAEEEI